MEDVIQFTDGTKFNHIYIQKLTQTVALFLPPVSYLIESLTNVIFSGSTKSTQKFKEDEKIMQRWHQFEKFCSLDILTERNT